MANKKITILFSEEDLQELQSGESFDWTFDGVDVHLAQSTQSCAGCGEQIEDGKEVEYADDVYCSQECADVTRENDKLHGN